MKTIWILSHYAAPPSITTAAKHYYMAKHLIEHGYNVKIFSASAIHNTEINLINDGSLFKEEVRDGVPFVNIKTRQYKGNGKDRILNLIDFYKNLLKTAKKMDEKPDLIFACSFHLLTTRAGIKLAKKYGIECICEIADLWPETLVAYSKITEKNLFLKPLYYLEKWVYKKTDKLLFTMQGGKDYILEKKIKMDLNKVYHLNNGVDLEEYYENLKEFPYSDDDLSDESCFKVLYTGSIRMVNAVDKLVDVAEVLKNMAPDIKLLIWGGGDYLTIIESKIEEKKLDNIVMKGQVDKKFIPSILSQSNATLLHNNSSPMFKYGISFNKQFDYLAAGRPIVSTFFMNYNLLLQTNSGIASESDSPKDIAEAIVKIASLTQDEYKECCDNAKEAAKSYDYKALTEKFIEIINS